MNTFNIIADSPQEAIIKARETFGPEAVIQEVRKQPRKGFSRLWKQPRLELVVEVPAPTSKLTKKETLTPNKLNDTQNHYNRDFLFAISLLDNVGVPIHSYLNLPIIPQTNPTNVGLECSIVSYSHSPSVHSVTPALSALQALP